MTHSHKHKDHSHLKKDGVKNRKNKKAGDDTEQNDRAGSEKMNKTEVKDAHASGIGALGRSDENQIQKLSDDDSESDDVVY